MVSSRFKSAFLQTINKSIFLTQTIFGMHKFTITYLCFILSLYSNAQTLIIKDKQNHQPIELVSISSPQLKTSLLTDLRGRASISVFKNCDSICFQMIGYSTIITSYRDLEKKHFQLLLEPIDISLEEIVVSAIRKEQLRKDIPNRISSIKPAEVSFQNPQTAADMLTITGDVFIQKSQLGGGSPMIRGFATNRILLAVDGVRMNTAIFRSGNLQNVISIDPLATEKSEVIFGPGSVVYGSDAIGGVMNFYTLPVKYSMDEKLLVKGNALTRWSSANNERTGHFDVQYGKGRWGFVTSATYSTYSDLKMGSNGPGEYLRNTYTARINGIDSMVTNSNPKVQKTTGYNQVNLMQKIGFRPNKNLDINYGFHYSATTDCNRYDRLIRYKNGRQRSAEWYYGPQIWMMNTLSFALKKPNLLYDKMNIIAASQFFKESRHDRDFRDSELRHRTENVNASSLNADLEKSWGNQTLFYGAEVLLNNVESTGENEDITTGVRIDGPSRYPNPANWNSYATYLNYRFKPSDKITLQTGLRYNLITMDCKFDTTFYPFPFTEASLNMDALTGSLGLAWSPTTTWLINLNFSSGFRAPNIDDIGKVFDSEPGSVVVPNPDLTPEYAWNGELSAIKIFGKMVKLDLSVYYTLLDNALVRRNYLLNGNDSVVYSGELSQVQATQNAASAYIYGIQAGIGVKLPFGLGFNSRFNYQKGEEELDDGSTAPLRHAAPLFGSTHLTFKRERFIADLYLLYNGEVSNKDLAPEEQGKDYIYAIDGDGKPYSPAWHTLNCKASYQITDQLLLSTGIENITDQRYRPYSSGIVAAGRNYIISVKVSL